MFKIELKRKDYLKSIGEVFEDSDVLRVPEGTYLKVLTAKDDPEAINSIILRTDSFKDPFVTIESDEAGAVGGIWGNYIKGYSFRVISYIVKK